LFIELDGVAGLAQVRVDIPQVAERVTFVSAVAKLVRYSEVLLKELNGATALTHGKGICMASFDGSARFLSDPKNIIERSFSQGSGGGFGNTPIPNSAPDKTTWSGYFASANRDRWT